MSAAQPMVKRQTIKQAKADFKARGRPAISEGERKQIERAIELERRAWRTKEQEKRKAEAIRKRQEKERREREERQRMQLGSQRRCDRFGHKSSQFHLGAFFGGSAGKADHSITHKQTLLPEADMFEDDLDDATLLNALESPNEGRSDSASMNAHFSHSQTISRSMSEPCAAFTDDFRAFWDEIDSSTQVARELEGEDVERPQPTHDSVSSSFRSGEFDLTVEELDQLDAPRPAQKKDEQDRKLMPPPALPSRAVVPPAKHERHPVSFEPIISAASDVSGIRALGITLTELASFVDDDLQLTQAEPG